MLERRWQAESPCKAWKASVVVHVSFAMIHSPDCRKDEGSAAVIGLCASRLRPKCRRREGSSTRRACTLLSSISCQTMYDRPAAAARSSTRRSKYSSNAGMLRICGTWAAVQAFTSGLFCSTNPFVRSKDQLRLVIGFWVLQEGSDSFTLFSKCFRMTIRTSVELYEINSACWAAFP